MLHAAQFLKTVLPNNLNWQESVLAPSTNASPEHPTEEYLIQGTTIISAHQVITKPTSYAFALRPRYKTVLESWTGITGPCTDASRCNNTLGDPKMNNVHEILLKTFKDLRSSACGTSSPSTYENSPASQRYCCEVFNTLPLQACYQQQRGSCYAVASTGLSLASSPEPEEVIGCHYPSCLSWRRF
jgi:hypothetical protein